MLKYIYQHLRRITAIGVGLLALCSVVPILLWQSYTATTPRYPNSQVTTECLDGYAGSYLGSADFSYQASTNICLTSRDQPDKIDHWYQNLGWEFGGKVGGYWEYRRQEVGAFRITYWRRMFSSNNSTNSTNIMINVYVNLELGTK